MLTRTTGSNSKTCDCFVKTMVLQKEETKFSRRPSKTTWHAGFPRGMGHRGEGLFQKKRVRGHAEERKMGKYYCSLECQTQAGGCQVSSERQENCCRVTSPTNEENFSTCFGRPMALGNGCQWWVCLNNFYAGRKDA